MWRRSSSAREPIAAGRRPGRTRRASTRRLAAEAARRRASRCNRADAPFRHILVPLNGTQTTAAALAETLTLARERELEVTVLHVHELDSLPLFTDQPQHELTAWAQEFLQRHCPHPEQVRLVTRVGLPGQHLLALADEIDADLIALGWAQELAEGHAAVVREALERSHVPVLLVPVTAPVAAAAVGTAPRP